MLLGQRSDRHKNKKKRLFDVKVGAINSRVDRSWISSGMTSLLVSSSNTGRKSQNQSIDNCFAPQKLNKNLVTFVTMSLNSQNPVEPMDRKINKSAFTPTKKPLCSQQTDQLHFENSFMQSKFTYILQQVQTITYVLFLGMQIMCISMVRAASIFAHICKYKYKLTNSIFCKYIMEKMKKLINKSTIPPVSSFTLEGEMWAEQICQICRSCRVRLFFFLRQNHCFMGCEFAETQISANNQEVIQDKNTVHFQTVNSFITC